MVGVTEFMGGGRVGCSLYDPAATCKGEARTAVRFQGFSDTDAWIIGRLVGGGPGEFY